MVTQLLLYTFSSNCCSSYWCRGIYYVLLFMITKITAMGLWHIWRWLKIDMWKCFIFAFRIIINHATTAKFYLKLKRHNVMYEAKIHDTCMLIIMCRLYLVFFSFGKQIGDSSCYCWCHFISAVLHPVSQFSPIFSCENYGWQKFVIL